MLVYLARTAEPPAPEPRLLPWPPELAITGPASRGRGLHRRQALQQSRSRRAGYAEPRSGRTRCRAEVRGHMSGPLFRPGKLGADAANFFVAFIVDDNDRDSKGHAAVSLDLSESEACNPVKESLQSGRAPVRAGSDRNRKGAHEPSRSSMATCSAGGDSRATRQHTRRRRRFEAPRWRTGQLATSR